MLEGILSISGQPGLYKLISQTKNGIIVESTETKKRIPVYSNSKVSALEDIAVFTTGDEVPLKEVFKKIYAIENKGATSVSKTATNNEIKEYFEDILPNYDKDRVYVSDMKKIFNWYNLLLKEKIISDETVKTEISSPETNTTPAEVTTENTVVEDVQKPKSKTKQKKEAGVESAEKEATAPKTKKSTPKKDK